MQPSKITQMMMSIIITFKIKSECIYTAPEIGETRIKLGGLI
ncbi:hypothetical protein SAMN04488696_0016 [Methanolobus profundi]|uniref:Uncharacterized protein n=1 Tax=Methanolobus profundi TaxID=487685 RepID=A0A1I4NFQ3_9EURY|nr:hypothetical protein SAMN04488696_0016 [Methanolobus profundi]